MREQFVEIKTAGGVMEAFVTHPEDNRPFPAVVIYMDIWGVREELYDIARRYGASVENILQINGLRKAHLLKVGTTLRIPKI